MEEGCATPRLDGPLGVRPADLWKMVMQLVGEKVAIPLVQVVVEQPLEINTWRCTMTALEEISGMVEIKLAGLREVEHMAGKMQGEIVNVNGVQIPLQACSDAMAAVTFRRIPRLA